MAFSSIMTVPLGGAEFHVWQLAGLRADSAPLNAVASKQYSCPSVTANGDTVASVDGLVASGTVDPCAYTRYSVTGRQTEFGNGAQSVTSAITNCSVIFDVCACVTVHSAIATIASA